VITTLDLVLIEQERIGPSGFPLFMLTRHGTATWTNPETGKSVTSRFAGSVKDVSVTDNGDGTITVRTALNGIAEFLRSDDGTRLLMDVGRVVFVAVLDYNGTPTDVDDDELVSFEVESVSGPHPDLDSDGESFCETLVAALT